MAKIISRLSLLMLALTALLLQSGCVKGEVDLENCPPQVNGALYLRVMDSEGLPIADPAAEITTATIYIFDENERFMTQFSVPAEGLADNDLAYEVNAAIADYGYRGDKIFISAWGDVNDRMEVTQPEPGDDMDEDFLRLMSDNYGGATAPGNQFFGKKELDLVPYSIAKPEEGHVDYIDIERKNSRLAITVRNVKENFPDASADDFYFVLEKQNVAYDFNGEPTMGSSKLTASGCIFRDNGDMALPLPLTLIHSYRPDEINADTGMILHLYKKGLDGEPDVLVESDVARDVNDNRIALFPGRTTNVLIVLPYNPSIPDEDGEAELHIIVNGWHDPVVLWEEV